MVKQMFSDIFQILAQLCLYILLKWQLVSTPSFVMPWKYLKQACYN